MVVASLRIIGGHSVQAKRLQERWQADGSVAARIVPIDPVPQAPFDRLLRIKYVRTVVTQLCYWPLLFRQLRHVDVVHAFAASGSSFLLAPLPAVIVAKLFRKPVILNYHSGAAEDHLRRSATARFVMRHVVDATVVPSAFLREVLRSFEIEAVVVHNTIDLREFTFRHRAPLQPRLLCTRNLEPLYNVSCLLRAFARVQAQYPAATLTLVGGGSQDAALRIEAAALKLNNVTFTGPVPPAEIHRYYAEADVYLQAPSIDNMPLSVLEAFASGLPVVSTNVGGVPSILRHRTDGLLVPANDDESLAQEVISLLKDPRLAHRLVESAYQTLTAYEWPAAREGWLLAYRRVAGQQYEPRREKPVRSSPMNSA